MSLYVITDGKGNYIRRDFKGKYTPVKNRALADEFDELRIAEKVLKNNISSKQKGKYYILDEEGEAVDCIDVRKEKINKINLEFSSDDCIEQLDILRRKIADLQKYVNDIESRKDKLSTMLSKADKAIDDIEHYIEFRDLDDKECIQICQMQKDILQNRRYIKNEIYALNQFTDCKIDSSMLKKLLSNLSDLGGKKYTPRVLMDLFET